MLRSKLTLLGLCALSIGALAAGTSAAQAAVNWLILEKDEKTIKTGGELKASLTMELENETGSLLMLIVKVYVKILCLKGTITGFTLDANGALSTGGTATFEGCRSYNAGQVGEPEIEGCEPFSPGTAAGTIKTHKLKGQVQTNGEVLIEPEKNLTLALLEFNEETCPLPSSVLVSGVVWLKDCEDKAAQFLVTHLIVESKAHGHTMWVGAHNTEHLQMTELDGSANVKLIGGHAGLKWRAVFP